MTITTLSLSYTLHALSRILSLSRSLSYSFTQTHTHTHSHIPVPEPTTCTNFSCKILSCMICYSVASYSVGRQNPHFLFHFIDLPFICINFSLVTIIFFSAQFLLSGIFLTEDDDKFEDLLAIWRHAFLQGEQRSVSSTCLHAAFMRTDPQNAKSCSTSLSFLHF